ncbi:MAG: ABC transporter ATP-binding protein [Aquificaceae bacterium]|nr:ABC transporter ATP-binding protein [Aquificaceae bacterium]
MRILTLTGIKKKIGSEEILKGIDLTINRGEFVAILGASGSGKSSLLYIAGLLDAPSEGEVRLLEQKVDFSKKSKLSYLRNKHLGFVFQFHFLLPEFTLLENVMLPALKSNKDQKEIKERALQLIEFLGLKEKINRRVYQLSGGEMQRTAIARALINNPELLLADEPTGSLDSKNTQRVMEIFKKVNELGTTILMVTHELELTRHTTRIIEVKDGLIIRQTPN